MEQVTMDSDTLEALVKRTFAGETGEFRPCAFFDDRLDCIRVVTRDCSVLEQRIDNRLTLLLDNYYYPPGPKQCVGFTVKGARHFCKENNLPLDTPITMSKLLTAVLANCPDILVRSFIELVVKPLMDEKKIEVVEMPEPSPASA
jgi:hypothetical protein